MEVPETQKLRFSHSFPEEITSYVAGWLAGGLTGWLVGWLAHWLAGWLAGLIGSGASSPSSPPASLPAHRAPSQLGRRGDVFLIFFNSFNYTTMLFRPEAITKTDIILKNSPWNGGSRDSKSKVFLWFSWRNHFRRDLAITVFKENLRNSLDFHASGCQYSGEFFLIISVFTMVLAPESMVE